MTHRQSVTRPIYPSRRLLAGIMSGVAALIALSLLFSIAAPSSEPQAVRAAPADCGTGISGDITQDTTWSGDIYLDGDVTVEDDSTLTITAGSRILVCGDYRLRIGGLFSPARLVAVGTPEQPITFTTGGSASTWSRLEFGDHLDIGPSVIRHAVFENGGGSDPTTGAAILVDDRATIGNEATPVFEQVTVQDSNGSGFDINTSSDDATPPTLRDVFVENNGRYPVELDASAVSGLLSIQGSGNVTDTIYVRGGSQGTMTRSQRWRTNAFPYEVVDDVNLTGNYSATWTIDPGVEMQLHSDVDISIGGLFDPTRLIAQGTVTQPITFTAATDQPWGQLYFGDHLDQGASFLQHVVFEQGGGSDPAQGETINVSSRALVAAYPTPLIDHVTIRDSHGYGITVDATGSDPSPAQLTHVTVAGSSLQPINVNVNAVGGLGAGLAVTGNATDTLRVFQDEMNFDSRWRDHGVPYEVVSGFGVRSNYPNDDVVPAVWTVDPGVTIQMHPDTGITVGSLYGEAQVMAKGTVDAPVTFTRLSATSDPWRGFSFDAFSDFDSEFEHVTFDYGGGLVGTREAVFLKSGDGDLLMTGVSIQHSENGAIRISDGDVWVKDSILTDNRYGIDLRSETTLRVRSSDLSGNAEFALNNASPGDVCVDAVGNDWGPGGPTDASATEDACGSTRTNAGSATVSDGVAYMPWRADGQGGFGQIAPGTFWVLADGQSATTITVTLLNEQGEPLVGKNVSLDTTLGTLQQPTAPTDENGEVTGVISSTQTGFATVTAFNDTDDQPVPGTAGVNFWQGSGDFGGLVDPQGAPYASPDLELVGKPFQAGFPVEMRVPLQNSQSGPVDVEVVYGVTGLSLGTRFTPVYTATQTLQPGDQWDALGIWVPDEAGHHCIQAALTYDDGEALSSFGYSITASGGGNLQKNTDENPCSGLPSGPGAFSPGRPKGGSQDTKIVAKHFFKQSGNLSDATRCIDDQVTFQVAGAARMDTLRTYQVIVDVPVYTPPPLSVGPNLTQAQVDALTALDETTAEILGLSRALAATRVRMQEAARADALGDLDRQYAAFLDFVERFAQRHRTLADEIDDLLAVTEGAGVPDAYFYPEDYEAAFDDLVQNGFDAETLDYLQQSGLSEALIDELRQDIIDETQGRSFKTTSFYQTVRNTRDEALQIAAQLERQYDLGATALTAASDTTLPTEIQPFDFVVGHPFGQEERVDLTIRPVSLPMDWSARLDQDNVTLGQGETVSNTLTLVPGDRVPEGDTVEIAVEGYVDGDYVGGILFTYHAPMVTQPRTTAAIFLPLILR